MGALARRQANRYGARQLARRARVGGKAGSGQLLGYEKIVYGLQCCATHKIRGVAKACTLRELTASRAKLSGGRGYERVGWQVRQRPAH